MSDTPTKKELDELITDIPSSEIRDIKKTEVILEPMDMVDNGTIYWKKFSNEVLNCYNNGISYGKFGNNLLNNKLLFKRLGEEIKNMISQEYNKNNITTENLNLHFTALFAILDMIAKEVDTKNVDTKNILANLHGFINSYIKNVK